MANSNRSWLLSAYILTSMTFSLLQPSVYAENEVNLDLSSNEANIQASSAASLETVGGGLIEVKEGDFLTAAQYAALSQVLSGTAQSLHLDSDGRAVGGSFSLSSLANAALNNLVVPANVTLWGAQNTNNLSLSGGLINSGTILAMPLDNSNSFQINTSFLQNNSGAVISSSVPGIAPGAINLNINTLGNVVNLGVINSSGVLSVNAGGSIINGITGQPSAAIMQGNLGSNLASAIGKIVNSGFIGSQLGNLSISTAQAQDLTINNTHGTLNSILNSVQISNLSDSVKGSIHLSGGLVEAAAIKFDVKDGIVEAFLNELRGPVDMQAGIAHLGVAGGNLALRNIDLSGDPSFVNSAGNITLFPNAGASLTFSGQDLAILASGDVIADLTLSQIDLSGAARGGNLFISAGFDISPGTGGLTFSEPPVIPGGYRLGNPSATGGSVRLQNISLLTGATAASAQGGNVTVVAHDDNNISEGTFAANDKGFVQVGQINTSSPAGTAGSVLIAAQSDSLVLNNLISANGATSDRNGSIAVISGEPVVDGLVFIDGTQQGGSVNVNNDASHDAVPINLTGALDPGGYFDVLANASGTLTIPTTTLNAAGGASFFSRSANIAIGDNSAISANGGALQIVAGTTLALGNGTDLLARDNLTLQANNGSITGGGGHDINSNGNIHITAVNGDFDLGAAGVNNFYSAGGTGISATGRINMPGTNQVTADRSIVMVAGDTLSLGPGQVQAGLLNPAAPPAGLLSSSDITSPGGVFLVSANNLQNAANLQSSGIDMMIASNTGNIQLAGGTTYTANGGHIMLLAGNQITGANNNFSTRAAGQDSSFSGGVIEVSAGYPFPPFNLNLGSDLTTNSQQVVSLLGGIYGADTKISNFVNTPDLPFSSPALNGLGLIADPAIMGANVLVNNNGVNAGLVLPTKSGGGSINLSGSTLGLNKGALFFDALGAAKNIDLQNSQFNTVSYSVLPGAPANTPSSIVALQQLALDLNLLLPEIVQDVSNINVPSERRITIVFGEERARRASGEERSISDAMGISSNTIFESRNFRGFDTGRIDAPRSNQSRSSTTGGGFAVRVIDMSALSGTARGASGGRGGAQFQPLGIMAPSGASQAPVRVSQQRSDLVLFTTAGQVLTGSPGGSSGATAIGASGTTVSEDKDGLLLHGGKIYANSGKTPMKVLTVFGNIILAPECSAAIEVNADGTGRIIILGADPQSQSTINIGSQTLILKTGEQLSIKLPEGHETLALADIERGTVIKEQVPVGQMIDKENEGFFRNRSIRMSGSANGAYQRMLERIEKWNGPLSTGTEKKTAASAQGSTPLNQGAKPNQTRVSSPAHVLAADGSIYRQEGPATISISIGSLFLRPNTAQTINTALASLRIGAGAGAEAQVHEGQVRFRSFSGPGKVEVLVADKKILLAPGQELVLQRQKPTRSEALPHDGIARRGLTNFVLPDGTYGIAGDFSIISSIQAEAHLRPLIHPSKRDNHALKSHMLKTAASLNLVRGSYGRYFMANPEKSQLPEDAFIEPPSHSDTGSSNDSSILSKGS